MGLMDELDRLDKAIKNSDISLKAILINIEKIDNEIAILAPRKLELQQNIEFHKKSGTIPIAHEFKNARTELSKTTARLILLTSDRKKSYQACKDIEEIMEKFKRDHIKLLKTSENNVLRVLFGVKRGKK